MPLRFRDHAARALAVVRRYPAVHRPVHAVAVWLSKRRWGEDFIVSVLEPDATTAADYKKWITHFDTLSAHDRRLIRTHIARMPTRPLISVVMPVYSTPPKLLKAAVRSVRRQLYPHWELCIADDGSPDPRTWPLVQRLAKSDPRIKAVRRETSGHICAATNTALSLATGEFVALMDHDDLIPERALYEVAAVLERHPDADLIYSDEDKIDDRGVRFEPHLKTDWNAELILGQNMVSHLGVYRRSLVEAVGGLREGFEGSQDHDLTLRVAERTTPARIHHIPWVLYHWRQRGQTASFSERQLEQCASSAKRAVEEHLARTGVAGAEVSNNSVWQTWLNVRRPVPEPAPLVSVIVPTRDRAELLARCADGVLNRTDYPAIEFIIVDNGSAEAATGALFAELKADPRVRILDAPGPFNFSALNNLAAKHARGEILLLLNNDVFVRELGWLSELVSHAVRPSVGAVGGKLLYPDGTVQHGGVILGVGSPPAVAGHSGHGKPQTSSGYFGRLALTMNVSAVTAACLALRRSVYEEVRGLDEVDLKVAFNDVDLCLKIRAAGYDIVFTPLACLDHHELASRGSDMAGDKLARFKAEVAVMRDRWEPILDNDPFYGPLSNHRHGDFSLEAPPRRRAPWLTSDSRR